MKVEINNYYWTIYDFIIALAIVSFLFYGAYKILIIHGGEFTNIIGVMWGMGTLGFFFLYQLPIFGNSLEAQKILDRGNKYLTDEEAKIILKDKRHAKMPSHVLKKFIIFFCVTGGVTLYGVLTST